MTTLMTYMSAFGLASGAGAKACIPILALGAFHYTPYFELSGRFLWIADPAVMVVLGVLVVLEIVVDAHPDLGPWSDVVSYLPKIVAGFIGFAAVVGTIDSSLAALAGSGLLGAGTAAGIHWTRNTIRLPFRDTAEDLHEGVGKLASLSEAGVSAALSGFRDAGAPGCGGDGSRCRGRCVGRWSRHGPPPPALPTLLRAHSPRCRGVYPLRA